MAGQGRGQRARASLPSMDGFLRDGIEYKCNTGGIGVRHCTINQSQKESLTTNSTIDCSL